MRLGICVSIFALLAAPSLAMAQTYATGGRSVIRPAGYGGWRNYVAVPDGPCGCAMPVRTDCYNECCPHCGLAPLCLLSKLHRMLDCLLPCNRCCGPFAHGCVLGGRCGHWCGHGCGPACGIDYSPAVPTLTDPFQDDPETPKPQPASEVRRPAGRVPPSVHSQIRRNTFPPQQAAPWKVTTPAARGLPAPHAQAAARAAGLYFADQPGLRSSEQSVLRRASGQPRPSEPAPLRVDPRTAQPIVRSQSPADDDIPYNPLRK